MKRHAKRLILGATLLACFLALFAADEPDQEAGANEVPPRVERLRGLAEIWGMVHYFHPALDDHELQEAWSLATIRAIPEVEAAGTTAEYGKALQLLVSKLGDSSTRILFPNGSTYERLPIILRHEGGRTVVQAAGKDIDYLADSIVGRELLEVNDTVVSEYLDEWLPYASGETLNLKYQWVYERLLSAPSGTDIVLGFMQEDGEVAELRSRIPTAKDSLALIPEVESTVLGDNVLWVKIPSLWALTDRAGGYFGGIDLSDYYTNIRGIFTREATIIDFRSDGHSFGDHFVARRTLPAMLGRFTSQDASEATGMMQREHRGLVPEVDLFLPSYYSSGWRTRDGETMGESLAYQSPLVFLIDEKSYPIVMPYLAPLQQSSQAIIMGEMGSPPCSEHYSHGLPGGLSFLLRLDIPSSTSTVASEVIPVLPRQMTGDDEDRADRGIALALAAIDAWNEREKAQSLPFPSLGVPLMDESSIGALGSTSAAERLLGLFEIWSAVKYFYGYPKRIDGDWDSLLEQFIPVVEVETTAAGYGRAIQELLVYLRDAHALVFGMPWGSAAIPWLDIREIEGKAVVVSDMPIYTEEDLALRLPPGQVILEINGEPVSSVLRRVLKTTPGATEAHRRFKAHQTLLLDMTLPDTTFRILDEQDNEQVVKVYSSRVPLMANDDGMPWTLQDGIAYIDLGLLTLAEYAEAEDVIWASDGVILDLRGGIQPGIVSALADLVYDESIPYLQASIPVRATPDPGTVEVLTILPRLSLVTPRMFGKSVVLLADVAATSFGETIAMFLQASGRVVFVGETTSGTNGDVTAVKLPLGLSAVFSGMEVKHVDGRPFQGIGIIPDVIVHPTIQGIREGRDEIFEKGLEVLQELIAARQAED